MYLQNMERADVRKRYQEESQTEVTEKRLRSGENDSITRLTMSCSDFGKCVGKGGQNFSNIRKDAG